MVGLTAHHLRMAGQEVGKMVERIHVTFTGGVETADILPVGTRVRDRQHPTLTGTIRAWEYHESGYVSPIPYNIEWDDHDAAYALRGLLGIYATDGGVEPIE